MRDADRDAQVPEPQDPAEPELSGGERAPRAPLPAGARVVEPPREPGRLYQALGRAMGHLEVWGNAHHRTARVSYWFSWMAVVAVCVITWFQPPIGEGISLEKMLDTKTASESGQWIARTFEAHYDLERDDQGRLRTQVTESIELRVPEGSGTSSIDRSVISLLDTHDLGPSEISAELDGAPAAVTVVRGAVQANLRVAASSGMLTGDHSLRLTYTLNDLAIPTVDEATGADQQWVQWEVFGPDWPHVAVDKSVTVTMPVELADELAAPAAGGVAYAILQASTPLEREDADGHVVFSVTNDQSLPPYSAMWFRLQFAPDTFPPPPPAATFWAMVWAPFVPVVLVAILLLLVLAARAVIWRDARGRAWWVPTADPPDEPMGVAAAVWGESRTVEIAEALARDKPRSREIARAVAVVRQTPMLRRVLARLRPGESEQFLHGLRRKPTGFIRDIFVGTPILLLIVQITVLRQLWLQPALTQYWWPIAFVLVTLSLTILVLGIALFTRPLTRRGALLRQDLQGLELHVRTTSEIERAAAGDPLLPWAVLFASPDQALRAIARTYPGMRRQTNTGILSTGRIGARIGLIAFTAVAIGLALWGPTPDAQRVDAVWASDLRGSLGIPMTAIEADARLTGTTAAPRLEVIERMTVQVDGARATIPQVMRQYDDHAYGHDMRFRLVSVQIDGTPVTASVRRAGDMALISTALDRSWSGEHHIEIRYAYDDPIATIVTPAGTIQQLTWSAVTAGWDQPSYQLADDTKDPFDWQLPGAMAGIDATLTIDPNIGVELQDSGTLWRTYDQPGERRIEPATPSALDGAQVLSTASHPNEYGYIRPFNGSEIGFQLRFADGTFTTNGSGDWWRYVVATGTAQTMAIVTMLVATALGLYGVVRGRRLRMGGWRRDLARWVAPWCAAAGFFLSMWASRWWSFEDDRFSIPFVICTLVVFGIVVADLVRTRARE